MQNPSKSALKYWSRSNEWFIKTYNKSKLEQIIHAPVKRREEVAVLSTSLTSSKTILDLGCGPCRVLTRCIEEGNGEKGIGIDFSDSMIKEAKTHISEKSLNSKIKIQKEDLLKLEAYPKADISIALGLFDYINDLENIISKAHQSSRYFVASWPGRGVRNYLRKFRYSCPVYSYTIEQVSKSFSNLGIKNVHYLDNGGFSGFLSISCRD